jgi:3-hydroxyisobutyrate dehydrogenase
MGGRMGQRLMDKGYSLLAFDSDASKPKALGMSLAHDIGELAKFAEIILLSLPDSRVIESVCYGDDGLLGSVRDGQVVVDLSTARVSSSRALCTEFRARGVEFIDAGISGGAAAAEKGTLTIMAGGEKSALDRVEGVLKAFSSHVFYMGESGSGHLAKVLNNFLNGISLAATAEVMVAAKKAGMDLVMLLEVINKSSGVNFATLNRFPHIVHGDYLEGGLTGRLMAKDLSLYLDVLRELGVVSLQGPSCLASFEVAIGLGYGDVISNHVVDALGDLAGGVRLNEEA